MYPMTQERFFEFLKAVSVSAEGQHFANAYIVAAFDSHDIGSRIVIDTKSRSSDGAWFTVHTGTDGDMPPVEVTFSSTEAIYDKVLRGELGIMYAIASRRIAAEGKVPRAMRLVPAFESCLPLSR